MKFVTLTLLFLHYVLAPLANAEILEHVALHHLKQKHSHTSHDHDHAHAHHHGQEDSSDNHSKNDHEHSSIKLEIAHIFQVFQLNLTDTSLFRDKTLSDISIKENNHQLVGYSYNLNKPHPPPDSFRNLPLII